MSLIEEFKKFAIKGNVVDMAVGILVGVAFNNIVNSLVNDVIMPPVGYLLGGEEFKNLKLVLREAGTSEAGLPMAEVAIRYGSFVNTVLQFFIIALSAFFAVKMMNHLIRKRENGL